jgi:hypothetical protein
MSRNGTKFQRCFTENISERESVDSRKQAIDHHFSHKLLAVCIKQHFSEQCFSLQHDRIMRSQHRVAKVPKNANVTSYDHFPSESLLQALGEKYLCK